ncbi:GTPase Ylf2 [Schizosaccharomyces pombe]
MPNIGKSTLFQILTKTNLGNPANYPFATIDPVHAKAPVLDSQYELLCEIYQPKTRIPAQLTIYDTAGLTRNSSKGEGLGNAFLSNIRSVDALFQLVRAFPEAQVPHVEKSVDPVRDLQIIQEELLLKDAEFLESYLKKEGRSPKTCAKALDTARRALEVVLGKGRQISKAEWNDEQIPILNSLNLLTAKPVVYLVNMDQDDYLSDEQEALKGIKEWVEKNSFGDQVIPLSVLFEEQLFMLTPEEAAQECASLGKNSQLSEIICAGYSALNLIHYFTASEKIVQAWTIADGSKAPDAAGIIHSDFKKKFVAGEVIKFSDFEKYKSVDACKSVGKCKTKGKDYTVEPGDIIFWKIAR